MLNVGVIGVGYLGQHHARIFSELAEESNRTPENLRFSGDPVAVRLSVVVDSDENRAKEIAKKYRCDAFVDYRDALDKADAFSIVAPTTAHYEIAMSCIMAGKDILIEKPITATIEEAETLIKAAEKAGVIVQVGHLERFNPVISTLYSMIKDGLIENPLFIEAERVSPFLGRGTDVDITLDLMIHDIDIILALIRAEAQKHGRAEEQKKRLPNFRASTPSSALMKDMKATGAKVLTDNIDFAKAWIEFENGANAIFTASRIATEKSRKLTLFQRDSYIVVDYQDMEITKFFRDGGKIAQESIKPVKKEPLKEELKDFLLCIDTRSRPKVCAIKGRDALKIALQVGEKIRQGWQLL
jgi:predicted dehydrogenase